VWLDLCSGLGGASQPALDRGWKVIRVDIDPRFKPNIVADVRHLPLKPFHVDVLWASPPCQEFSKWGGLRCFYPNPPKPDLSIAQGIKELIESVNPRFWVIENVFGSRQFLTKLFGPVRCLSASHALWSNLGFLLPNLKPNKRFRERMNYNYKAINPGQYGLKPAEAAKIPYEIGEAICAAVERRVSEEQ
jgi:hypothetical protein